MKAVTIQFNGAEYLDLVARARQKGMSIQAYVITCCGFPARGRLGPPQEVRPIRLALERRSVTIHFTDEQYAGLDARHRPPAGPGGPIPQFVRSLCGFRRREGKSLPNTEERDVEINDADELLRGLGLDPEAYFRAGEF